MLLTVFITGCTSIKNTLTGVPKESTDEFFVKKKNPLDLPPDFDNLHKNKTKFPALHKNETKFPALHKNETKFPTLHKNETKFPPLHGSAL